MNVSTRQEKKKEPTYTTEQMDLLPTEHFIAQLQKLLQTKYQQGTTDI